MKLLNKILSIILISFVVITTNGFFLFDYFCACCDYNTEKLCLFAFGNLNTEEKICESPKKCSCCNSNKNNKTPDCACKIPLDEESQKASIKFYSISLIFCEYSHINLHNIILEIFDYFDFFIYNINFKFLNKEKLNLDNSPPINLYIPLNINTFFSVFRL